MYLPGVKVAEKHETERQRREKQAESLTATHNNNLFGVLGNKLPETNTDENKAATKLATTFNTNRTYINEAAADTGHHRRK